MVLLCHPCGAATGRALPLGPGRRLGGGSEGFSHLCVGMGGQVPWAEIRGSVLCAGVCHARLWMEGEAWANIKSVPALWIRSPGRVSPSSPLAKDVALHPGSGVAHCMSPTCSPRGRGPALSACVSCISAGTRESLTPRWTHLHLGRGRGWGHLCVMWRDTAVLGPLVTSTEGAGAAA